MVLIPGGPFCRTAPKEPASSGIQLTDVCYILEVVHLMVAGEGLSVDIQLAVSEVLVLKCGIEGGIQLTDSGYTEVQVLDSDLTRL